MRVVDSYLETGPRSLSSQLPTTVCLTNLKPSDHRMLYDLWSRCFLSVSFAFMNGMEVGSAGACPHFPNKHWLLLTSYNKFQLRRNYSSARISTTKPSNQEPRGVVFAPAAGLNTMAAEAERDRDLFFARLALTVQRRYHTGKLCSPRKLSAGYSATVSQ